MQSFSYEASATSSSVLCQVVLLLYFCLFSLVGDSNSLGSGTVPLSSSAPFTVSLGCAPYFFFFLLQTVRAWPWFTAAVATLSAIVSMDERCRLASSLALLLNMKIFHIHSTGQIYKALATSHSAVRYQRSLGFFLIRCSSCLEVK